MLQLFTETSQYKKQARFVAIIWTLLIFILCFLPGKDIPKVKAPFIDKWVHLVLFGGFAFLWLCAKPFVNIKWLIALFLRGVAMGSFIELMQGALPALGRTCELMDAVADSIGTILGIVSFCAIARVASKNKEN